GGPWRSPPPSRVWSPRIPARRPANPVGRPGEARRAPGRPAPRPRRDRAPRDDHTAAYAPESRGPGWAGSPATRAPPARRGCWLSGPCAPHSRRARSALAPGARCPSPLPPGIQPGRAGRRTCGARANGNAGSVLTTAKERSRTLVVARMVSGSAVKDPPLANVANRITSPPRRAGPGGSGAPQRPALQPTESHHRRCLWHAILRTVRMGVLTNVCIMPLSSALTGARVGEPPRGERLPPQHVRTADVSRRGPVHLLVLVQPAFAFASSLPAHKALP